ncbi:hypothetical protein F4806DRAFT_424833 [Annulohypoxylon nitens]|nr:hypothetical protein F4806DRAFT_424833 [Annulohypoxylon nitens]
MTIPTESSVFPALETRLLSLEKQLSELTQKYNFLLESTKKGTNEVKVTEREPGGFKNPSDTLGSEAKVADEKKADTGPHSRVKIVKTVKDRETGERVERQDETPTSNQDDASKFAFVLRKTVDEDFIDNDSEIDIKNQDL